MPTFSFFSCQLPQLTRARFEPVAFSNNPKLKNNKDIIAYNELSIYSRLNIYVHLCKINVNIKYDFSYWFSLGVYMSTHTNHFNFNYHWKLDHVLFQTPKRNYF